MFSVRPATIFLFIFALTAVLFSSCTITQRRYRSGFHLEWKHRLKGHESVQANSLKDAQAINGSANTDTVVNPDASIRPVAASVEFRQNNVQESEISNDPIQRKTIVPQHLNKQRPELKRNVTTDVANKNLRKKSRDRDGGGFLLVFLITFIVLVMPPLLFAVANYWIGLSKVAIVFVWIVWIAGIVSVFLLFSGFWPIFLSCLIWNIVFTISTLTLVFIND